MTWAEFEGLSMAQLEALEYRRGVAIRYERFNAALITSAILNANRGPDSQAVSPFSFVAGFEPDPEDEERAERRRNVKQAVAVAMMRLPDAAGPEAVAKMKDNLLSRVKAAGFEDAEDIYKEVFAER